MFEAMGVLGSIKYSTAKEACEDLYNRGGNTCDISSDIAWGKNITYDEPETSKARANVLLIDEVSDVIIEFD